MYYYGDRWFPGDAINICQSIIKLFDERGQLYWKLPKSLMRKCSVKERLSNLS